MYSFFFRAPLEIYVTFPPNEMSCMNTFLSQNGKVLPQICILLPVRFTIKSTLLFLPNFVIYYNLLKSVQKLHPFSKLHLIFFIVRRHRRLPSRFPNAPPQPLFCWSLQFIKVVEGCPQAAECNLLSGFVVIKPATNWLRFCIALK